MQPETSHKIECPRCGYPFAGDPPAPNVAERRIATCTECGLRFDWDTMLHVAAAPRWLFEYAPWKRIVWSFIATVGVAAIARKLFRSLKIEHPIRPLRLCALAILVLSLLYVIAWMQVGVGTLGNVGRAKSEAARWSARQFTAFNVNGVFIPPTAKSSVDPLGWRETAVALAWSFVAPMSDAPIVFRRTVSLTTTLQPPVLSLRAELDSALPQSFIPYNPAAWNNLAARPFEVARIASPADVWRGRLPFIYDVTSILAAIGCSCATFVVLPFARARAKVRWAQLGRCAVYLVVSLPIWLLAFGLVGLGRAGLLDRWGTASHDVVFNARPILGVAVLLWLSTWWYAAVGGYLRMERPLAVALSVSTIGMLAGSMLFVALQILVES